MLSDVGAQSAVGDGVESSDYESECDIDPNNPLDNYARRAKVTKHWRTYREFNGSLSLSAIPDHASKFQTWRNHVRAGVTDVSKAGHKAYQWILRVEDRSVPDDAFRVVKKKWEPLDSKLRAALLKLISGEVARTVDLHTEQERVQHRRQITGCFILRLIYRRFQTKNSLSQFYDQTDLAKVTLKHDSGMTAFLHDWMSKLNGLEHPEYLHPAAKLELFVKQLRTSQMMKYDMEHYKRLPDGHEDKCYTWLVERIEDRLVEERTRTVESQLGHGGPPPPALAAPEGTICPFNTKGFCRKGAECDMVHDQAAKAKWKRENPDSGGGGGRGSAGGGGAGGKGAKGGKGAGKGVGAPQAKAEAKGKGKGKLVGAKGGNSESRFPCYANHDGNCINTLCSLAHRVLTEPELAMIEKWEKRAASRTSSPGAPATGVCPEWLRGNCILGPNCSMEHPEGQGGKGKGRRGRAKAAAGP